MIDAFLLKAQLHAAAHKLNEYSGNTDPLAALDVLAEHLAALSAQIDELSSSVEELKQSKKDEDTQD